MGRKKEKGVPWSIELNNNEVLLGDSFSEVGIIQSHNKLSFNCRDGHCTQSQ